MQDRFEKVNGFCPWPGCKADEVIRYESHGVYIKVCRIHLVRVIGDINNRLIETTR